MCKSSNVCDIKYHSCQYQAVLLMAAILHCNVMCF